MYTQDEAMQASALLAPCKAQACDLRAQCACQREASLSKVRRTLRDWSEFTHELAKVGGAVLPVHMTAT